MKRVSGFFCVWEKGKRNPLVVLQQEVQLVLVGEWVGASAAFQIYQWSASEELSRKHSPFFKSVCLQAWSEFDTGNRLRSNWDDHFTSSWPVRWLRAVIITKRGEHETSGFSTHHCALHMLTCFLFLSACNSWTKQKKHPGFICGVILHTVSRVSHLILWQQLHLPDYDLFTWRLHLWISTMIHEERRREEERYETYHAQSQQPELLVRFFLWSVRWEEATVCDFGPSWTADPRKRTNCCTRTSFFCTVIVTTQSMCKYQNLFKVVETRGACRFFSGIFQVEMHPEETRSAHEQ